jgi:hypothetical protein
MNYTEFRRWGYVSRLSTLLCGPSSAEKTAMSTNSQITQQQLNLAQQQQTASTEDKAKAEALQAPLIAKETALASGDRNAALAAAMPTISKISSGYEGAKQSVFNSVAPGAARDTALANLEVQKSVAPAQAMAQSVENAPEILANIGSGVGAFSLQELGASLSGYGGASTTNQSNLASATQQQAAKLGVVGDLVGAAGGAATAGIKGLTGGSDRQLKKNIAAISGVLEKLTAIQPVTFEYIPEASLQSGEHIGVIAQEIQPAFPQAIYQFGKDTLGVDYAMLSAVALQAAKELHGLVLELTERVKVLESVGREVK